MGQEPWKARNQADELELICDELAEAPPAPALDMLRVVAESLEVPAPRQAAKAEPGFPGHRDHHVTAAHPGQLTKSPARILQMFEDFEAENQVERSVGELELVDALPADLSPGNAIGGGRDAVGPDVDRDHAAAKGSGKPLQHLALAAARVEHGLMADRPDDGTEPPEVAVDQTPDERVPRPVLGDVGRVWRAGGGHSA